MSKRRKPANRRTPRPVPAEIESARALLENARAEVQAYDQRIAQCEKAIGGLVEMASPDGFRKAVALVASRASIAALSAYVEAGTLVRSELVQPVKSAAVLVREMRGDEVVTPQLVLELAKIDEKSQAMFVGHRIGELINAGNDITVTIEAVWDHAPAKKGPRSVLASLGIGKGARRGR